MKTTASQLASAAGLDSLLVILIRYNVGRYVISYTYVCVI